MPHWPDRRSTSGIFRAMIQPGAACSLYPATNRQSATSGTPRPTIRSLPGHGTGLEGSAGARGMQLPALPRVRTHPDAVPTNMAPRRESR